MSTVYLDGTFVPRDEARISVLDRGFVFGDGVYEVIPAYSGAPFRLEQHLARLAASLAAIEIPPPLAPEAWRDVIATVLTRNGGGDQSVYIQVTRGVAERDHAPPAGLRPTVLVMSKPMPVAVPAPVAAISRPDIRWQYCDIKTTALLANVMLRREAAAEGAYETILLRDGRLTEGAASNVFVVSAGHVRTPPRSNEILAGITRDLLLELLREAGVQVEEAQVSEAELRTADEIWITSSTREIVPVTMLDGAPVGAGVPGAMWRQATALYQACKSRFVAVAC